MSLGLENLVLPHPAPREPELSSVLCGPVFREQSPGITALVWGAHRRARFMDEAIRGTIQDRCDSSADITANRGCGRGRRVSRSNVGKEIAQQLANLPWWEGGGGSGAGGERGRGWSAGMGGAERGGAGRAGPGRSLPETQESAWKKT